MRSSESMNDAAGHHAIPMYDNVTRGYTNANNGR